MGFKCWELVTALENQLKKEAEQQYPCHILLRPSFRIWNIAMCFMHQELVCACVPRARVSAVRLTLLTDDIITAICFATTNVYIFCTETPSLRCMCLLV